jgi:acyl-CoA thioester hydrolase
MAIEFDLTLRSTFRVFEPEKIRFSDTDMIGHVNNVAFAALLESGRTAFGQTNLFPHMPKGFLVVMARVEIDYRRELHWPLTVDVGTRIIAVGRASYVMGQGIFRGDTCATTGRTTLVMIDRETRRSAPMPDDYRAILDTLLAS